MCYIVFMILINKEKIQNKKSHLVVFIHPRSHFVQMTAFVAISSIRIMFALERIFLHDGQLQQKK